ncbi:PREDICTED: uncharacterized protein LOC109360180 [Lupinus angustifolius]|uniref:uncharacterized protein LOC109360180 n=1 Tax=Lupinus angustifolius TaxID=3871 RepID=UPI00092F0802|nr:PREDICTED: uncharacterized protein LOC109360180 [Lupinus angustifolius]
MDKARDCINKTKKPAFIQLLFPAYVNPKRDVLGINSVFAKEYLKGFEGKATIGVLHEKKTWPVRININHCTGQTSMTGGWKSFWQHYKLQVNDVCVFEMTQHTPLSFKVIIFPAREVHKELQGYGNEAHQHPPQREKKIKIYIGNNHLRSTPNIPIDFLKRYPKCDGKDVKLQVGEEWWVVKLIYYPHYCFGRFSRGWYAFVRECKLEVENNWEFDMIDEENLVFKVSISN